MPRIDYLQFGGEKPIRRNEKLGATEAQTAKNCKLWTGAIEPLRGTALEQAANTAATPKAIYLYNGGVSNIWIERDDRSSISISPVPNDPYGRIFIMSPEHAPQVSDSTRITSSGAPYPSATLDLGVPRPTSAVSASVSGTPDDANQTPESRFYTVTLVNSFGEEGPPPVNTSGEVLVRDGEDVDLVLPGLPAGNYDYSQKYIYRTNNGVFQFVAAVSSATTNYTDSLDSNSLGEILPAEEWLPPPSDLQGHVLLPGGMMAAFRGNEVRLCEPGLPHAWPARYSISLDYEVKALGVVDGALVAMTEGMPVLITGTSPSSMTPTRVRLEQACVSERAVAQVAGGVVYASPDGLVYITPSSATVLTRDIYERDQWAALKPSTMLLVPWEDLLLVIHGDTSVGSFLINPRQPEAGIVQVDYTDTVEAVFRDLLTDKTYLSAGNEIREWDGGATLEYTYRTRKETANTPTLVTLARVFADSYPVKIKVYADGNLQTQASLKTDLAHRLQNAKRSRFYELEIISKKKVTAATLASSMTEVVRGGQ